MNWQSDTTLERQTPQAPQRACAGLRLDFHLTLIMCLQLLLLLLLPHAPVALAQRSPDNRLAVALRTTAGQGIAGVTVTLAPRPAELGGPADQAMARTAITDQRGWVAFDGVPGGIWLLSFAGSAAGFPLQPSADQGRPPYGTTPNGGGFTVAVGEDGDDIGTDETGTNGGESRVVQALLAQRQHSCYQGQSNLSP